MRIVAAVDSFKGSLNSIEAGNSVREGILRVNPDAEIVVRPLADGGEGTVRALVTGLNGIMQEVEVTGPLGEKVTCAYGILENTHTAVIEMAGAAGITLVPEHRKNPMETTTYGVGEVIADAIQKGCRKFLVGIGGSATNDGGIGMLQALGYGMLDEDGRPVPFGAKGILKLAKITKENVIPQLSECSFKIACDVTNPLCGEQGASAVYGPQKGADEEMVRVMDRGLAHFAELSKTVCEYCDPKEPGTGAAGGLGFAFLGYTHSVLESGVDIVLEETNMEQYVKEADLVITGEGKLDGQSAMGKAPIGVAKLAKKYGKTVVAFSGVAEPDAKSCNEKGIDAYFPILQKIVSLEEAMSIENAKANLADTAEQVYRLWCAARS